jgi:hypothetical protein
MEHQQYTTIVNCRRRRRRRRHAGIYMQRSLF